MLVFYLGQIFGKELFPNLFCFFVPRVLALFRVTNPCPAFASGWSLCKFFSAPCPEVSLDLVVGPSVQTACDLPLSRALSPPHRQPQFPTLPALRYSGRCQVR